MSLPSSKEARSLGSNLVFILSQPRTGSTLLTRLLSCHSKIDALGETRILQPSFMALNRPWSEADSLELKHSRQDIASFFEHFADGKTVYYEGMRKMFNYIYDQRLLESKKCIFVDKTPRYAYFIPELYKTFPKAKYLFLFRHPLAVLSSIFKNWTSGKNPFPNDDLELVPKCLLDGMHLIKEPFITTHYETLVATPEKELSRICEFLGFDFEASMLNYGSKSLEWQTGDTKIHSHTKPVKQASEAWKTELSQPSFHNAASQYLNLLGREQITSMGYDYNACKELLDEFKPTIWRQLFKR